MAVAQTSRFPLFSPPGRNPEKWISKPHRHIGLLKQSIFFLSKSPAAVSFVPKNLARVAEQSHVTRDACVVPAFFFLCLDVFDAQIASGRFEAWRMTLGLRRLQGRHTGG